MIDATKDERINKALVKMWAQIDSKSFDQEKYDKASEEFDDAISETDTDYESDVGEAMKSVCSKYKDLVMANTELDDMPEDFRYIAYVVRLFREM